MKQCIFCNQWIEDDSVFCEKCGGYVGQNEPVNQMPRQNEPMNQMPWQSEPMNQMPWQNAPMNQMSWQNEQVNQRPKKDRKDTLNKILLISCIVAGVVLVGAVLVFALYLFKDDDKSKTDTGSSTQVSAEVESEESENELEDVDATVPKVDESEITESEITESEIDEVELVEQEIELTIEEPATEEGIHRYAIFIDDCSWSEAFNKARASGGYLVRINTAEEYHHILNQIEAAGYDRILFRLGGRRDFGNANYYWVDENNNTYGEALNSTSYWAYGEWLENEPSYYDQSDEENCLEIFCRKADHKWVWNDVVDDHVAAASYYSGKLGYIVEYED